MLARQYLRGQRRDHRQGHGRRPHGGRAVHCVRRQGAQDRGARSKRRITILRVDVVKDGKYIYTTRPNSRTATLRYQDADIHPGKSYYYVRVFERDTDAPEGDPEIAWGSPFYVTYQ